MPVSVTDTAARLSRDVPLAELSIDDALIAVSVLMTSIITARRETPDVPAARGQATIRRLAKAQTALIDASGEVLRVHGDLRSLAREVAGYDLHECPKVAGRIASLRAVA
ncbi:hypothetical protein [Blastomonas fulva]|uniref:hypothetical protein n=1 Tax=Blastomonas fulva TaxID=1550728 RepID=UPI003F6FE830